MAATLREYISIKPPSGNSTQVKAMRPLIVGQNRLGGAVSYFGTIVEDLKEIMMVHADATTAFVEEEKKINDDEHLHRSDVIKPLTSYTEIGKKKDKKSEVLQEKNADDDEDKGKKLAKDEEKEMSWFGKFMKGIAPLIKFLSTAFTTFLTYGAFKWLADPNNTKAASTVLKAVSGIVGFAMKLGGLGISQTMDGITRVFGVNPDSKGIGKVFDKMFGVFQIVGGLSTLWAASRVLMPWKLVGDVKMMKRLGQILKQIKNVFKVKGPKVTKGQGGKVKGRPKVKITGSKVGLKDRAKQFAKTQVKKVKNIRAGLTNFGSNIGSNIGNFIEKAKNTKSSIVSNVKNIAGKANKFVTKHGKTAYNWGKNQAKNINNLAELVKDPKKLASTVQTRLKDTLRPVIEKNPTIKKLLNLKNVEKAKNIAKTTVKAAITSKEMADLSKFLKGAKDRFKIGGIDKVIAAVMGLVDYGLGESPINAIINATAGLLGYSAGFALGAPFGGVTGFLTGAVGGIAGDFIGNLLLKGMAKTPGVKKLTEIPDPLAPSMGLSERPLLRDLNPKRVETVTKDSISTKGKVSGNFDLSTGKGYINGREVPLEEYSAFANMSAGEKLAKYGKTEMAAGGIVEPTENLGQKIKGKKNPGVYSEQLHNLFKGVQHNQATPMTSLASPVLDLKVNETNTTTLPTPTINNKVGSLTSSSEAKVQRSKETTRTTRLMVMRQQIIRSVQTPPPRVLDASKSVSPLIT